MTIQDIKQKLPLTNILTHYGLEVKGNNRLHCPFHEDKKPSMEVYLKTDTAYCFSSNCKAHGKQIDVIDFVMHQENLTKHEAIVKCKTLIDPTAGAQPIVVESKVLALPEKDRISTLKTAFSHFQKAYKKSQAAQDYMKSRSLEHVGEVGYHDGKLSKTLIEQLAQLDIVENWAKGCIIFPLKNETGEIVSLYGRSIKNNDNSRHFYSTHRQGLYPAYPDPKTTKYLIITESIIDAASLPPQKDTAILALYGTNGLTPEHKKMVKGLDMLHEIMLFFDGDEAGRKGMRIQAENLWDCWKRGGVISGVPTPDGEDINSILQGHEEKSKEVFLHLLSQKQALSLGGENTHSPDGGTPTPVQPKLRVTEIPMKSGRSASKFDKSNPQKLVLETVNARYQVQGKPKPELESMKITLFIYSQQSGSKSRHKLDLYEDRQIEKTARESSEKLGIAYELLLIDLNILADALETYRDKQLSNLQKTDATEKPKPLTPKLQKECMDLLKSPQLMEKLSEKIGLSGVVGEEMNRVLLFCVASSYKMPNTLHAIVQGSSGSGKTHLLSAIEKLMPIEDIYSVTRVSERGLYHYDKYELRNKLFVIQDLDGLGEEALLSFRELISYEKLSSSVAGQDTNGQIKSYIKEVFGPIASMTSTTQTEVYEDNENRCFTLAVNESSTQTKAIINYMNACSVGRIDKSKQLETRHLLSNCVRLLQPYEVINPYAEKLALPIEVHKARRLHSLYQALVKQITLLHQFQRKRDSKGRVITTKADLHWANTILFDTIILRIDELDGSLRQFFEKLKNHCSENGVKHEFTRREIRQKFRLSSSTLHRYMRRLGELEYIQQVGGHVNKGWSYKITYWDDLQALRSRVSTFLENQLRNIT